VLLVVGLPVSPLAVSAAVHHEATAGTGRKFWSTVSPIRNETIATNLGVGSEVLLALLFIRHCGYLKTALEYPEIK
jgi:hypothetical protein